LDAHLNRMDQTEPQKGNEVYSMVLRNLGARSIERVAAECPGLDDAVVATLKQRAKSRKLNWDNMQMNGTTLAKYLASLEVKYECAWTPVAICDEDDNYSVIHEEGDVFVNVNKLDQIPKMRCVSIIKETPTKLKLYSVSIDNELYVQTLENNDWVYSNIGQDLKFLRVTTGKTHYLAVTTTGHLYGAGENNYGQTGHKTHQQHRIEPVTFGEHEVFICDASAGYTHSLALTNTGTIWAFGDNEKNQCFRQTLNKDFANKPVRIYEELNNMKPPIFEHIAAGGCHSLDW